MSPLAFGPQGSRIIHHLCCHGLMENPAWGLQVQLECPLGDAHSPSSSACLTPAPSPPTPPRLSRAIPPLIGQTVKTLFLISSLDGHSQPKVPKSLAVYQEDPFKNYDKASALFSGMRSYFKKH